MSQGLARRRRAAIATCDEWMPLRQDDRLLVSWLERAGITVHAVAWDDPAARWGDYDIVVVRSVGHHQRRSGEFDAWIDHLEAVGARVFNPAPVLRWNLNPRYLDDLVERGVPVVPTTWFTRDRAINLAHTLQANGWRKAVVKPARASGGANSWITDASSADRDQRQLLHMLTEGDVMLQPLMPEIARDGEYSLVFFGRHFSHAVIKRPKPGDFRTHADHGGRSAPVAVNERLVEQASAVLAQAPGPLLYARVNGIVRDGAFVLMQLELLDPDLGLSGDSSAAQRFAAAIGMAAALS